MRLRGSHTQFSIIMHNKTRVVKWLQTCPRWKCCVTASSMDRRLGIITRQTFVLSLSTFNGTSRESGWRSYLERNVLSRMFAGWQWQWYARTKLWAFGESNLPDGHRRSAIYRHALIRRSWFDNARYIDHARGGLINFLFMRPVNDKRAKHFAGKLKAKIIHVELR